MWIPEHALTCYHFWLYARNPETCAILAQPQIIVKIILVYIKGVFKID